MEFEAEFRIYLQFTVFTWVMLKIGSEKNLAIKSAKIGQFSKSRCVLESSKSYLFEFVIKNRVFNLLLSDFFEKSTKNADFECLCGVLQKIAENRVNFLYKCSFETF